MIFGKQKTEDEKKSEYILYQVKHGVRLDDVLRNFGYEKLSIQELGRGEKMTEQETAKKLLPIIQAIADGKQIQMSFNGVTWIDATDENFSIETACKKENIGICEYRIKPEEEDWEEVKKQLDESKKHLIPMSEFRKEKHYRPFEETSELILYFQQRFEDFCPPYVEPLIWVKKKVCSGDERNLITAYDIDCVFIQDVWIVFSELFENYTFLDNSPCGIME